MAVEFSSKPIIITGPNGVGKTNILEAISLLAPGRGIRDAKLDDIDRKISHDESAPWKILASVNDVYGRSEIFTERVNHSHFTGKRIIKIDDQLIKSHNELAKIFSIIWLIPQMDPLFISKKEVRRKFLDRLVYNFDPEHAARIGDYSNLIRQRSKLLKNHIWNESWIKSLEHTISEISVAIACARVQTLDYIQNIIDNTDSPFPKATLLLEGDIESKVNDITAVKLEEYVRERFYLMRKIDSLSNRTNAGIHRSDMIVYHKEKNMRADLCSTGEQKAMLITIILAEAKGRIKLHNSVPVLLLDEVVAHLDQNRRIALMDDIIDMKAQAFITGTDISLFSDLGNKAEFIEIEYLKK